MEGMCDVKYIFLDKKKVKIVGMWFGRGLKWSIHQSVVDKNTTRSIRSRPYIFFLSYLGYNKKVSYMIYYGWQIYLKKKKNLHTYYWMVTGYALMNLFNNKIDTWNVTCQFSFVGLPFILLLKTIGQIYI